MMDQYLLPTSAQEREEKPGLPPSVGIQGTLAKSHTLHCFLR